MHLNSRSPKSSNLKSRNLHWLILVVALSVSCSRGAAPGGNDLPQIAFEKYTLPNGLEVVLSEDRRLPLVAVDIWYHVGPANEAAGRTGFAHLFEHMMFQGSKHVAADAHFRLLEAAGGTNLNGTTDFDRTNYFQTLPMNQLELGLWLESDRMGYLLETVDELKLANQQDVVRNERAQNTENVPYGIVNEAVYQTLFPKGHPYYGNVIGSHGDIQAAKLADVKSFFKQYYAPNNASLAIVGDIDKAKTKALVEKYFGSLKRGPAVPKPSVQTPAITAERRVVIKDRVEMPRVHMAWLTPAFFAPGDADADASANILGGGKSSRLYKKLVYEKQIAQDVTAYQQSLALGSVFHVFATVRPGKTVQEVETAIDDELKTLREAGPDAREVERARNTFETNMLSGLEVLGGFGGVADTLNLFNHYTGDPGYLPKYLDEHRRVTPASVKTFAARYLQPSSRVVVHGVAGTPDLGAPVPTPPAPKVAPGTGAEALNADEPWRKDQPAPAGQLNVTLPTPATFKLANGLTVIHHERAGVPIVAASLVVRSGGDANPVGRPGLANFTAAMLDSGTATRSALQIADDVAQIGASLTATSSKDAITASVSSLRKNFTAAIDLLADVTLRPNFPVAEVDRERASRLAQLVAQRQDPATVGAVATLAALYGPRHPYGYVELGTDVAAQTTGREHLEAFWKQHFAPSNAALVVAGSITAAELRPLVEKAFGGWSGTGGASVLSGTPSSTTSRIVLVDQKGAQQTQLYVATIGPPRSAPDYPAIVVMNNVLGGLFSSRINMNLREAHGYTYGAFSEFVFRRGPGPFWIQSGVRTDVTAPAIAEILKEIKRLGAEPVTAAELTIAKDAIVRGLPSAFETSGTTVGTMSSLYLYDLGLDYFTKFPALVAGVTADAVKAAAAKHVSPDRLVVIAVGDRAKIEPGLLRLGLGAVELRDTHRGADGKAGQAVNGRRFGDGSDPLRQRQRGGFEQGAITVAEGRRPVAVDVDFAEDRLAFHDRHDDLRLRLQAAREVPRIGVHVVHDDRRPGGRCRPADAAVERDARVGRGLAEIRSEHELVAGQHVDADPGVVGQALLEHAHDVFHGGLSIGGAGDAGRDGFRHGRIAQLIDRHGVSFISNHRRPAPAASVSSMRRLDVPCRRPNSAFRPSPSGRFFTTPDVELRMASMRGARYSAPTRLIATIAATVQIRTPRRRGRGPSAARAASSRTSAPPSIQPICWKRRKIAPKSVAASVAPPDGSRPSSTVKSVGATIPPSTASPPTHTARTSTQAKCSRDIS